MRRLILQCHTSKVTWNCPDVENCTVRSVKALTSSDQSPFDKLHNTAMPQICVIHELGNSHRTIFNLTNKNKVKSVRCHIINRQNGTISIKFRNIIHTQSAQFRSSRTLSTSSLTIIMILDLEPPFQEEGTRKSLLKRRFAIVSFSFKFVNPFQS